MKADDDGEIKNKTKTNCQFDKELKTVNDQISHPFGVDHLVN